MPTRRTMQPSALKLDVPPEKIIDNIKNPTGKKIAAAIFDVCLSNGIRFKPTAPGWTLKVSDEPSNYNVHFLIKGSKDAFYFNTNGFNMSLRIKDLSTFDKLDEYSENIRNYILNGTPCPSCRPDDGTHSNHGEYVFTYHGKEYRKCQSLMGNFKLWNLYDDDIDSLMDIINREIEYAKIKRIK